jgi:hypothetical protein
LTLLNPALLLELFQPFGSALVNEAKAMCQSTLLVVSSIVIECSPMHVIIRLRDSIETRRTLW